MYIILIPYGIYIYCEVIHTVFMHVWMCHLQIQGMTIPNPNAKQIHIAYHNGDHYSSVRKLNDNLESPANIRLKVGA